MQRSEWSEWPAPAKINRFLHVVGRRPDGYHLLQTLFQFVSLEDTVRLRVTDSGGVSRVAAIEGVPEADDLAMNAARALLAHVGWEEAAVGLQMEVIKRVPMGGGLGGGSSNAATVLVALNDLLGLHLPPAELAAVGQRLGADVPVFVHGKAAWAEGTGEQLTPVTPDEPALVLLTPDCAVNTGRVFQAPALTRDAEFLTISGLLGDSGGVAQALVKRTRNDCAAVTEALHPIVREARVRLEHAFGNARMTGTGATVFSLVETLDGWQQALGPLPTGWRASGVQAMNQSPLHERLARSHSPGV